MAKIFRSVIGKVSGMASSSSSSSSETPGFRSKKEFYLNLPLAEKRKHYRCSENFKILNDILTWEDYVKFYKIPPAKECKFPGEYIFSHKVSLWQGDITQLEIDAIVNAANSRLIGGGGVDGSIHRAANSVLKSECLSLGGCATGETKITGGYRLPAKYILHTVGPMGERPDLLESCYKTSMALVEQYNLVSVAFPCIATGVYGYPGEEAARVALNTVRTWLDTSTYAEKIERVIFCVFLGQDHEIYKRLMPDYFPV